MVDNAAPPRKKEDTRFRRAKKYSLGSEAKELYDHLAKDRERVIDTAREMAKITIPSLMPPEGYKTGDKIGTNEQSANAMCVNTLASKLMFMALPTAMPVLRFEPIEHKLQADIRRDPHLWTQIDAGLGRLEIEHRKRMEATTIRSAYVGAMKQLVVAGNVCWEHNTIDNPLYHSINCYVVKRNNYGQQLFVILKRTVDVMDLDEDIQDMIYRKHPEMLDKGKEWERQVDIYAVCKRVKDINEPDGYLWEYWEEYEGEMIPDTEFTAQYDAPPLYAAWMIPVYGQNWGRSYCEEYRGDLTAIENFSASLGDGAAAASLILLFLKPGSRTSAKQLRDAQNMEMFTGSAEDLSMFKTEKMADFNFVSAELERAIQRVGRAFLLVSSVQRQAERVTAEEWIRMAQEIDQAMGGVYSELAQSFQRLVVNRFVVLHNESAPTLPKLPPGIFRVGVITGIEVMGRSTEGDALVKATGTYLELGGTEAAKRLDYDELGNRIYISAGVKLDGLMKSPDVQAQEAQQAKQDAMRATLMEKASGPVAGALAKGGADTMVNMANQAQQNGAAPPGVTPSDNAAGVQPQ